MSVGLWLAECSPLADPALFEKAYDLMPSERRIKISQMRFDKDKRLSLGAGLLLRHALKAFGLSETSSIRVDERGKPYLKDIPDLYFNLSHSGTMVCCAMGTMPVGCDIERHDPRHIKIAKRFFTKAEQAWLEEAQGTEEETQRFFRLWTLKESFIKATGFGLSYGLERFSVIFKDDLPILREEVKHEEDRSFPPMDLFAYTLYEPEGIQGYGTALCLRSQRALVQSQWVDLSAMV